MNSNTESEKPALPGPRQKVRPIRFLGALLFVVTYWPFAAIVILLFGLITKFFMSEENHQRLGQKTLGHAFNSFIGFLVTIGAIRVFDKELKEHADTPGPLIVASNHPALWDALLIIRRFVWVSCIMKRELTTNPLLCTGACFAGFIPNTPQLDMIRLASKHLKNGGRLLYFPEGTRTREENRPLNPFRPGLALLASQSSAPVLPIFITSDSRYLQKGWPIWRMPMLPITVSLRVGEKITIHPEETVREFSDRLENCFKRELSQR